MESIGDARAFLSAAREVALNKPIIIIKAGRTEAAAKAAASHTGSLTGSDEVLDAAVKYILEHPSDPQRAAQMRAYDYRQLIDNNVVDALVKQGFFSGLFGEGVLEEQDRKSAGAYR